MEQKTNITAVNRVAKTSKIYTLDAKQKDEFLKQVNALLDETKSILALAHNPTPGVLLELLQMDIHTLREIYMDLITRKMD